MLKVVSASLPAVMPFCHIAMRRTLLAKPSVRLYQEVSFASHGEPSTVLEFHRLEHEEDMHPHQNNNDMVRVEMLYAPLNPADVNSIQGKYPSPSRKKDPEMETVRKSRYEQDRTVGGSGGLGIVTHISEDAAHLKVGDVVTMGQGGLGTYRTSLWTPASSVIPLDRGQELLRTLGSGASTLPQLGGTALRMLRDFVPLEPGEVVLQNAGNSAVGFMIAQLARTLHDVSVVSIVRRGQRTLPHWDELVHHYLTTGKCAKVVAEEDLLSSRDALKDFQGELRDLSTTNELPRLALNAVGGDSASLLQKSLEQGGTMVTYGGMSMRPVTTSTSQLIFRDLRLYGYWHSRWMVESSLYKQKQMLDELVDTVLDAGVNCPPVQEFSLSQIQDALSFDADQSGNAIRRKVVFLCQNQSH